ncbi:hypothetical protein LCGC14_2775070, partial [marine sediment metagenome]
MAYQARMGVPITIPHPVRDVNDDPVAGQASAVTKSLLKPDRTVDATTAVTLTDLATGWVQAVLTLPTLGVYTLTLANPDAPTADGRKTDYFISVSAGLEASATLLTSRDRVRTRLQLKNSAGNPITPGDSQLVIRFGKVIDTDILIAGFGQCIDSTAEHRQFGSWAWQVFIFYLTLSFKSLRQMRIVKDRQAIWRHLDDTIYS